MGGRVLTGRAAAPVRRAVAVESGRLAALLARAFHDDPVLGWVVPRDDRRPAVGRRIFALRLKHLLPHAEVYTTGDRAGAALWAPPGQWKEGLGEFLAQLTLAPRVGRRAPRVLRGLARVEAAHPHPPHYYLSVLGTEPDRQGEGIGTRLLAPVLEDCDADGIPAYLESSQERNLSFYARHGFRVTGEIDLPSGPRVWLMWRDPLGWPRG